MLYGHKRLCIWGKKFSQTHDYEKNLNTSGYSKDDNKPLPITKHACI